MSARTPPPCPLCAGNGVPLGALGANACLAFSGRRPAQRISPSPNGIRALLGGTHAQPRLHLGGAGRFGRGLHVLTVDRGRLRDGLGVLSGAQPVLELGELLDGLDPAGLQLTLFSDAPPGPKA